MLELVVNNSLSQFKGLTPGQHKELKALMSYRVDAQASYFSGNFRSRERPLIDKVGAFPTGLLYLAEIWLKESKANHTRRDVRQRPPRWPVDFQFAAGLSPYPEQYQAAAQAVAKERGIIVAPTGVGKSLICALIIAKLNVKTLVVVPSLELKRQTLETLWSLFGVKADISVENVDALDPKAVAKVDCVIIDEFHHAAAKTYRELNKKAWANVYYRFGLTATPFRSDADERLLLESVLSEVIYRIDYKEAVAKGYIVPLEAYYIEVPPTKTTGYTWAQVYKELVVDNHARNVMIYDITTALFCSHKSTLCLVKEIQHGHNINMYGDNSIPFANGANEYTKTYIDLFSDYHKPLYALLGTTGIVGEGVDTKPCEYVIIAGLGKSRNQFMQQVGRAFRRYKDKESAKVIIILDKSHKWTKAHFAAQVKILKEEYGVVPAKITVDGSL